MAQLLYPVLTLQEPPQGSAQRGDTVHDLNQVARFMFRQIAMVFALDCARDRRDGIRGSRIKAVKGSAGPELLLEAEDMTLRFWASKTGPGCTVVGAPVIGYLWCRWSVEPADRCIGVLVEDEGRVSWLTMAEGDLPADRVIDIHQAAIRSGPDRMAELTWDLRFTAKARALARQLPRELPKALREKIRSYQKGGPKSGDGTGTDRDEL